MVTAPLVPLSAEPAPILKAAAAVIVSVCPPVAWLAMVGPLMKRLEAWSMTRLVAAAVLLIVGWLNKIALLALVPVEVIWVEPEKLTVPGVKAEELKKAVAAEAMVGAVPVLNSRALLPELVVLVSKAT